MITAAVRWTMAWGCYWVGHLLWRIHEFTLPNSDRMAAGYQRAMQWADWWQGETTYGPWKPADDSF